MSRYYTSDPVADAENWYRDQEEFYENNLPRCEKCGEPIDDDKLFDIDGVLYHIDCAIEEYVRNTDNYIRED